MSSSFTKKRIVASLTLAGGSFGGLGNTVVLEGLRTVVEIEKGGHPSKNQCSVKVYGMKEADMDAATTTAFHPLSVRKNLLKIQAGDLDPLPVAFAGEITGAWAVYHEPPRLYFKVDAASGYYPAIQPTAPKSFQGGTAVSAVMQRLAGEMGYAFEDGGVQQQLANPYLSGSPMQQAGALADAAGIEFGVDDGVLWISPRGAARQGLAPFVTPDTGLIGYPAFDKEGLSFRSLYNPGFRIGGAVKVDSSIRTARGTWRIHGLRHTLDSEQPGGKWESHVKASYVGAS